MIDVELYAEEKGMMDKVDLLKRGALIAQDPGNMEALDLPEDEKEALRYEADHRWKHPIRLYYTIILCSIGAAVQGWDQTGYFAVYWTLACSFFDLSQFQRSQLELP